MAASDIIQKFAAKFSQAAQSEFRGETTFVVDVSDINVACKFCRDELGFDLLLDIASVDHFGDEPRFEVV